MRLDQALVSRGLVKSRSQAQDFIFRGSVEVNGEVVTKPSKDVEIADTLHVTESTQYVGRGGIKLEGALRMFALSPKDKICLDIGASTGGFTDCLLTYGASLVYAVDVGSDQLDHTLASNPRVVSIEQTDIRDIQMFPKKVDLVVIDVSFISLSHIVPVLSRFIKSHGDVIALIKPQFEVGKDNIQNGIVKNEALYVELLPKIQRLFEQHGFTHCQIIDSPIRGGEGNKEFFIHAVAPKV
jgi:23S rRNA (cytidine1920-2'-O)/16S rRNA (cytidine1409-2'-O)-methyltransferase